MEENRSLLNVLIVGWRERQEHLVKALSPLTPEQLTLRAAPHLRSINMLVAHLISARAEWFYDTLHIGDAQFAALKTWDQAPPPNIEQLLQGLESSWQTIEAALASWTTADLTEIVFETEWQGKEYKLPRQWVVWHVLEHDLIACGEISITLGAQGIEGIPV